MGDKNNVGNVQLFVNEESDIYAIFIPYKDWRRIQRDEHIEYAKENYSSRTEECWAFNHRELGSIDIYEETRVADLYEGDYDDWDGEVRWNTERYDLWTGNIADNLITIHYEFLGFGRKIVCEQCSGEGAVTDESERPCSFCDGSGFVIVAFDKTELICDTCKGKGIVNVSERLQEKGSKGLSPERCSLSATGVSGKLTTVLLNWP